MTFPDGIRIRRVTRIEGDETLTLDLLLVGPTWRRFGRLDSAFRSRAGRWVSCRVRA